MHICTCMCHLIQGMDIQDVEVVVVYGTPKTATLLYQVKNVFGYIIKCVDYF